MRTRESRQGAVLVAALVLLCAAPAARAGHGVDWVALVDDTGTMRYQGRGDMTVRAVGEFVSLTEPGDRVSIFGYGERPYAALPDSPVSMEDDSSRDHAVLCTDFAFTADRTDITAGLEHVWNERERLFPGLAAGYEKGGGAVIILLTDGKLIPVYDDYAQYEGIYRKSRQRLLELASLCGEQGIRICTVGLGREDKVDGELLEEIAGRTGGVYRHVVDASDVVGVYRAFATEQRPAPSVDVVELPDEAAGESAERTPRAGFGLQETAAATTTPKTATRKHPEADRSDSGDDGLVASFPSDFCLGTAGILAVFVGMIAVGTERRQRWAVRFSTNLFGTGQRRVRGYLKPIDMPGETTARASIGLENPGLESVTIGNGTLFLPNASAKLEFIGTVDGSPPELHVDGDGVVVEGEPVTVRQLRDGDIIDVDGLRYQYLRGNRR